MIIKKKESPFAKQCENNQNKSSRLDIDYEFMDLFWMSLMLLIRMQKNY